MRTPMTYPIRFWALLLIGLLILQFSNEVIAGSCKFEKQVDITLNVSASEQLSIIAVAGDLDVIGVAGSSDAVIKGKACASKQEWLDDAKIHTESGQQAQITVDLPELKSNWSLTGNTYIYMDLTIEVPDTLALSIKDSSGDIYAANTGALRVADSSGDIEIENAGGTVTIRDSSGDIDIDQANGDVTVESDSAGDILVESVIGSVLVVRDSSGDIDVIDVSGDVIVERDSSGSISAKDVGGDFRVLKDGSGRITSRDISGEVDIPEKS